MIRNILTIVHNEAMTYLLQTVLGREYHVSVAVNVFQAMQLLKTKQDVELVLIDVDHQLKESIDFILHLHSSKLYKKPVIVLCDSRHQKPCDIQLQGMVAMYFTKPFNPIDLVESIKILSNMEGAGFPEKPSVVN